MILKASTAPKLSAEDEARLRRHSIGSAALGDDAVVRAFCLDLGRRTQHQERRGLLGGDAMARAPPLGLCLDLRHNRGSKAF